MDAALSGINDYGENRASSSRCSANTTDGIQSARQNWQAPLPLLALPCARRWRVKLVFATGSAPLGFRLARAASSRASPPLRPPRRSGRLLPTERRMAEITGAIIAIIAISTAR
jgi:hypothetical protein